MRRAKGLQDGREWRVASPPAGLVEEIARGCGVSPTTAQVLANRGVTSAEEAEAFLRADLNDLRDPFLLSDMELASHRLAEAVRDGEKVTIYGDYDVDGITSIALLHTVLAQVGGRPSFYVPDRIEEGYGLNSEAVAKIARGGAQLLVALDCGIRSCEEVDLARRLGLDVLIVDHHLPGPALPAASALVCPKGQEPAYLFGDLASVGLTFKLGQALVDELGVNTSHFHRAFLDLVALGTVADIVPLRGENRTFVKCGLEALGETKKPGLLALMQVAGVKRVSEREVGFALAPRLNAAGRVRHAHLALNLLLTRDQEAAQRLARDLEGANEERQREQRKVQREVSWQFESRESKRLGSKGRGIPDSKTLDSETLDSPVLVAWGEGWHEGVLGIVASRVAEETGRPTILLTVKGEEARGSARSVPGLNITEALERCSDMLLRCGGHAQAAGLSVPRENLEAFRELINAAAEEMMSGVVEPEALHIDAPLALEQADLCLLEEMERLAPFGEGNPPPLFLAEGVTAQDIRRVGGDRSHLVFNLSQPPAAGGQRSARAGQAVRRCVAFNAGSLQLKEGSPISVCFHLRADDFGNGLHPQLQVIDVRARDQAT